MAERVVDRLEPVEIDQMDGNAILGLVDFLEHRGDALTELGTVSEPGQFIELGKMRDAFLRALAFSDVLENDDRTATRHHAARYCERSVAVRRSLELVERFFAQAGEQIVEDALDALGLVVAGPDAVPDQLRDPHADAYRRLFQMQQFQETFVPDLHAILRIQHAKAVRHVVERDVEAVGLLLEARGECGFLAGHGQRLNNDVPGAERDVGDAVHEQQHDDAEGLMNPVWIDQQCGDHRHRAEGQLTERDQRPAGVAA